MAPRKSTQSQSAKSKGKKRRRDDDDDEAEPEPAAQEEDQAPRGTQKTIEKLGSEGIKRHAASVVRLVLFAEQRKNGVRREDITKKILGKDSRAFQEVFDTAQRILRKTFGLELVPLRGKGKGAGGNGDVAEDDEPEQSASASRKKKKKIRGSDDGAEDEGEDDVATTMRQRRKAITTSATKSWMVRSLLPFDLYQIAAEPRLDLPTFDPPHVIERDDERRAPRGALIDFSSANDHATLGLLYTILALILVSGRRLLDQTLRSYLARLNIDVTTVLPSTTPGAGPTLDVFLAQMTRSLYLEKAKPLSGDVGRGQDGEDLGLEWMWGARADAEIGETGLTAWVSDVYIDEEAEGEDESDAERKRRLDRCTKREAKLRKDVARAAGGTLQT